MKKIALILACLLVASALLISCKNGGADRDETTGGGTKAEPMDISEIDVFEYVTLGEYKGLEITYSDKTSKGDAVWERVVEGSTVTAYPEQQVDYYFSQSKAKYEYLAKQGSDTYENILKSLGITEADMLEDARELTRDDLVFEAVLRAEGIALTAEDKENNFDRYVDKFVDDYGYKKEYVLENMEEQIYETMLFDKMLEKLITLNTFISSGEDR